MGRSFGNMADDAGPQLDAAISDAQPAPALNDVTDDIFVVMVDLFGIGGLTGAESNEPAGEAIFFETVFVADLFADLMEMSESALKFDDFDGITHRV